MGVGWAAARTGLVGAASLDVLGAFSFRFALPALVLRLIAGQPLSHAFSPAFYAGYLAAGLGAFALALAASRRLAGQGLPAAAAHATTASVGNLGFLGPPLMLAFFGERGAGPLAMAILAEVMVLLSIGGVLMAGGGPRGASASGFARLVLRGTALNPVVAAILAGAALAAAGVPLPDPVARFVGFLGAAAGPTALFALGGALALQRLDRATLLAAAAIAAVKLALYPLLVWLVLARALALDPFWVGAGVLTACLPPAGNIFVLAQRCGADPERVSAGIVLSTLAGVVTVPLVAWLALG